MSRDPVTITRAEAIRRRREEEQKKQDGATRKRSSTPRAASTRASAERPTLSLTTPAANSRLRRRYSISMSSPYRRAASRPGVGLPSISLPKLSAGPRWISFLLLVACLGLIYGMYNSDAYLVRKVTIVGNQRIQADELEMAAAIWNQPSFTINPAQVEYNLLASYPELIRVQVDVNAPSGIVIRVLERLPALVWQQGEQLTWVDSQGYAFPPRGSGEELVVVKASGLPPVPADVDVATQTFGARPFMTPELARAIATLAPTIPEGATLVYDPKYGLGWQDPLGWQVYFGQSSTDMNTKLNIYLSMVDYLLKRDIKPALISVEYPSAPFYRLED